MTPHGSGGTTARTRIVAMLNQKGGVGKTTTAVNLGAALAEEGWRVCLVDLDPQAHLTLHLGIDPDDIQRTVYDVLIDPDCSVDDAIIRNARPNLDALLAEVDLAGAETELAGQVDRQAILRDKFALVRDRYDVVLIDCPPSLGLLTLNALTMASELIVPMQTHFLALQGVGRLLETVGLVCQSVNPDLKVAGIVLCMHEKQTTLAREIVADLEGFFESARTQASPWRTCQVLKPPIRRNIKLAETPSFGQTIFDYEPWCAGALDYRSLAKNLIVAWSAPAAVDVTNVTTATASTVPTAPAKVAEDAREQTPIAAAPAAKADEDGNTAPAARANAHVTVEPKPIESPTSSPTSDETTGQTTSQTTGQTTGQTSPTGGARDERARA